MSVGMRYRQFGKTTLTMPVYSCGGMRYQHDWNDIPLADIPADNQANLEATIHRAIELGINHIETARGYGSSERQLGLILPRLPRDEIIVQTKIGLNADGRQFREDFLDSLRRLRLEYVDLLALHGLNTYRHLHWVTRPEGPLAAARALVDEGLVRHVGFSTHAHLALIESALKCDVFGGFDYINLHWYYIFQDNWPAIEAAHQRKMGVFIISPADKGGMLYKPPARLVELCAPLHPLVFNCLFCLARPQVHTLSLGASCPEDFELQSSALEHLDQVDTLLPPIESRLREAVREAVGADVAERYLDGIPDWFEMPNYVNARTILWLRLLTLAFDMREYAQMRYNLLGTAGHWFPGTNAAELARLDLTKALEKSPFASEVPQWLAEAHRRLVSAPQKRLSQS